MLSLRLTAPILLLESPPGVGKTTVARGLVGLLLAPGVPVGGFTTGEVRQAGRSASWVRGRGGRRSSAVIAHVEWASGPRVGRYRVDVGAFEAVALPALQRACALGGVVVIDELGRMELASAAFVTAVRDVLDLDVAVVATVHEADHPVTDALKQRADVARYVVTRESSEALPRLLRARLVPDRLGP